MLNVNDMLRVALPADYLQSWCTAEGSSKHKTAMSRLEQLRLLRPITIQQSRYGSCSLSNQLEPLHTAVMAGSSSSLLCRQGMAAYAMHEGFQHQLQLAQTGASSFIVQVMQGLCARGIQACGIL